MTLPEPFQIGQMIGQGFAPAAQVVGEEFKRRGENRTIDEILEQVSNIENPDQQNALIGQIIKGMSPENREFGLQIIQNKVNQLKTEKLADTYEKTGMPRELASLPEKERIEYIKNKFKIGPEGSSENLKEVLKNFGMDEKTASQYSNFYSQLSTGGKTAFSNYIIDKLQRGQLEDFSIQEQTPTESFEEKTIIEPGKKEELFEEEFKFPEINPYGEGLTPKEKVKVQGELFRDNSKLFEKNSESLKSDKSQQANIKILNSLNNSGKLPKGLKKGLTVNLKTGKARLSPSLQNSQTQLFIKTLNQFLTKAKEIFGARVTNFELDKFLEGLPTLANTEEGRRLILESMDVANKLKQLDEESLKKVYDNYGLRGIDRQQAESIAENLKKTKEKELLDRMDRIALKQEIYEKRLKLRPDESLVLYKGKVVGTKNYNLETAIKKGAKPL